jgi:ABC-type amino acid transport substrate-binding protein
VICIAGSKEPVRPKWRILLLSNSSAFLLWCTFLLLVFLLSSCGAAEPDLTWQRIQEQGVFRIGMDANWVPFEFVDGTGQLSGFDVALARELGKRLGVDVHFVANLSYDGLYDALTAGRADVIISAVIVEMGRSADFLFSNPYFDAGQVLVTDATSAHIEGMADLEGRVLATELGSVGDMVARRWARRLPQLTLLHTNSVKASFAAVTDGQADAAIADRASALIALKTNSELPDLSIGSDAATNANVPLRISGSPVTDEQYAAVVRKESGELLRALNVALAEMRCDGTLEQLEREWLGP